MVKGTRKEGIILAGCALFLGVIATNMYDPTLQFLGRLCYGGAGVIAAILVIKWRELP